MLDKDGVGRQVTVDYWGTATVQIAATKTRWQLCVTQHCGNLKTYVTGKPQSGITRVRVAINSKTQLLGDTNHVPYRDC